MPIGLKNRMYFSYVPTALSKPPATLMSSVAVMITPISVCIAFSTWLSSLARVGLSRFQGASLPWLNATSMDTTPFAKSSLKTPLLSVYSGSAKIWDSAFHPRETNLSFSSELIVDEMDFLTPSPCLEKWEAKSSSETDSRTQVISAQ